MNGKLWPSIFITVLIAMNGWMIHMQIHKADKLEAKDRWTGAQMIEYKQYVEARFNEVSSKLDKLIERGTDSRGSESE